MFGSRGSVLLVPLVGRSPSAFRFFCAPASSSPLTLEKLSGKDQGIAVLRLHKPDTKNAISRLMLQNLRKSVEDVKFDQKTRVLILKSDVAGAFCTGADLKERKTMPLEEVPRFVDGIRRLTNELSALPMPVIAAIDGFALGGGLELALACDIRVASASSKLGLVETKIAIIPGAGGTQRLSRLVGPALAKELIFTAKVLGGAEAKAIGLVNHVAEDPYAKAREIAHDILKTGPISVRVAKIAIDQGSEVDLNSGLTIEQQCYAQVINTKDRLEGLKAFAEKRAPQFKGE
ncbi:putative 3-hydroxybutyryl-CoA dehydratase [Aphelenchoides fujianensis]|nr:putative 3-hydroxybutyryl-CoA dehydratase [Aphelenchoides fujianensis]